MLHETIYFSNAKVVFFSYKESFCSSIYAQLLTLPYIINIDDKNNTYS